MLFAVPWIRWALCTSLLVQWQSWWRSQKPARAVSHHAHTQTDCCTYVRCRLQGIRVQKALCCESKRSGGVLAVFV